MEITDTLFMKDKQPMRFLGVKVNSSANPEKLSATIGGLSIVGLAQTISAILAWFSVPISQDEITGMITGIVTIIGSVIAVYGALRKIANRFILKK